MGALRTLTRLAMAGLFLSLTGCAGSSRLLSGALMENQSPDGQVQRLRITNLESWRLWHRNPIKGSGDNVIMKAELTF
jgi:hypothetical protein|uniref:Uncharacterized protein n=1 Tax=Desulfobacca acetoxidans TaxID=60893 RepID=A0A7C3WPY5_9BACT